MHKAYSLKIEETFFNDWLNDGKTVKKENYDIIKTELDKFTDNNGSLFAKKIIDNWFPDLKTDVFISHSHKDEKIAIGLAGWLKRTFGISSFIDSCVWGYSPKLIEKLDDKFCRQGNNKYNYKKRNITNSHVNIMLSTSLTKMIDQCECIIFLNTPNSISCEGCIEKDGTESPWIYAEIEATRLLRKKTPERLLISNENYMERLTASLEDNTPSIKYDMDLKHLALLEKEQIKKWGNCGKKGTDSLDFLYDKI